MGNDKKKENETVVPLSRRPGNDSTTGNANRDRSIEFGEGHRRLHEVLNTLPAPDPIKKK